MNIITYEDIYRDMVTFNSQLSVNYGNVVRQNETTKTTYPYTIIEEIRNTEDPSYNTMFDKISILGYKITVMAKTKGQITGQKIARHLSAQFDDYMQNYVGVKRTSFLPYKDGDDNSIYALQTIYTGNLHENRRKFL